MTESRIAEHHVPTTRTGRYYTLGTGSEAGLREVWVVCHGYGQLAQYFLRRFAPLDDGTRLIVAPEGLSRFYLGDPGGSHSRARVGATWMTREDRLNEIRDYVAYLDAVCQRVLAAHPRPDLRVLALGFSQGAATACRWTALGQTDVSGLVLWAERVPPDLDLAAAGARLRRAAVFLVTGTRDSATPPEKQAEDQRRLAQHGVVSELVNFGGGHELDRATLLGIAERWRALATAEPEP